MKSLWISSGRRQRWSDNLRRAWPAVQATLRRATRVGILMLLMLTVLRFDVPPRGNLDSNLDRLLAGRQFDFAGWWVQAFSGKVLYEFTLWQNGMSEAQQVALVRGYMHDVSELQRLDALVEQRYIDPQVTDKLAATAALRAERETLRTQLNARQNLVEAIMQEQVESVLREEGFAIGGQVWPPLRFRFTELPDMVIVSRRDRIERIASRELQTGLTVDQQDGIERQIDGAFDVSSLVTPIGGLGAYPTMLGENSALYWTLGVMAHEWTHNYFLAYLSPIGWNYADDAQSRTMNETAAVIVENEIGKRVVERYYPDLATTATETKRAEKDKELVATLTSDTRPSSLPSSSSSASSVRSVMNAAATDRKFDFRAEMRETRLRADELLAAGKVDEAEAYMEQRRQLFVQNGYLIRKLNQAYFAFHGAYNAEPGGSPAAGRDLVGPAVQKLRAQSATLGDFVRAMAVVQNFDDLQRRIK